MNADELQNSTIRNSSYLSKFGYVVKKESISIDELKYLKSTLIAKPLVDEKFGKPGDNDYPVYIETKNKIYIPKLFGITRYGVPKMSKEYIGKKWALPCAGPNENPILFKGTLLEKQKEPVQNLLTALHDVGGGILAIKTGGGKTVSALNVVSQLQCKTLIVVNKISLMKQWENEIRTFLPDATIGFIQGQKNVNVIDCHIVIAMLQSLAKIDYPQELFNDYSVVIYDECHNITSKVFSKIFFKLTSKYTIGLSATPQRSDGCEYVLGWHIGNIIYQSPIESRAGLPPIIKNLTISSSNYKEVTVTNKYTEEEQIQFTSMLSELIDMPKRNKLIVEMIKHYINVEDRKILLLTDRRNHVTELKKILDKDLSITFTYGVFVGSMKIADLEKSKSCQLILATYKAFSEGVSEASLNTLMLVSPKKFIGHLQKTKKVGAKKDSGQLNQIVGRIFRKTHTELNPMIIDFQDDFSIYRNQSKQRNVFYKQHFPNGIFIQQTINLDHHDEDDITIDSIHTKTKNAHLLQCKLNTDITPLLQHCLID